MISWRVAGPLAIAMSLLLPGCTASPEDGGDVRLQVTAMVPSLTIKSLVIEVSGPDIGVPLAFNLTIDGVVAHGTITIPAGSERTITMRAFDGSGIETHRGSVTVRVTTGSNPTLALTLLPLTGDVGIDVAIGTLAITVTPSSQTLFVNQTLQLAATVTKPGGEPISATLRWATLNPALASVSASGLVAALGPGTVQIVASYAGIAAVATVVIQAGSQAPPALKLIASSFVAPLFVTAPPGDTTRAFVVEQYGRIRIVRNDTLLPTPFLDVGSLISTGGERGLLGLAFHPLYAENGLFYVNYTDLNGDTHVARYHVSSDPNVADPASGAQVLFQPQPYPNHNGGMLAFGPDRMLYVGLGDGGSGGDPQGNGQNRGTLLGKILRVDVSQSPYTVPSNNPFMGVTGARPEIWAYGLRNPWRFSFDRLTGDLYIGDVGQGVREEIDAQLATSHGGENYGWNVMEGSACYNATTCNQTGLTLPVADYPHTEGCSVTGGYVYRGTRVPILAGRYLYSDFCTGWVKSFRLQDGRAVDVRDWTTAINPGTQVSSFGEDGRGELYITTLAGTLFRIVSSEP